MPRKQEISDDELQRMLDKGLSPAAIARKTGLNPSSISRRIAKLMVKPAGTVGSTTRPSKPAAQDKPKQSFEEKMKLLEEAGIDVDLTDDDDEDAGGAGELDLERIAARNLRRAEALLADVYDPLDVTRAIARVERCIDFSLRVHERLASVGEIRAFYDEVLTVLDEFEPGTRARAIARLEERRAVRSVTGGHSKQV